MASNTEAVPWAPGFCLVALRKVRRIYIFSKEKYEESIYLARKSTKNLYI